MNVSILLHIQSLSTNVQVMLDCVFESNEFT